MCVRVDVRVYTCAFARVARVCVNYLCRLRIYRSIM